MIMSFGVSAALGSIPRRVLYNAIPLFIAVILIAARLALFTGLSWLYPALWLGKEILNSLTGILIWGIAGIVCDTRQAKRLFPLFNASRILGQVAGGFVTGALVSALGVENLLLVWAGTLLLAFALSRALLRRHQLPAAAKSRQKQPPLIQEMQRGYQYVRKSGLMRWMSLAAILFSMLYFSISLPFSRLATEQYVTEENLAAFLGLFNGLSTAAAFLASLFLANRLFARFGIMLCLLFFSIIYLVGFASLAILPIFAIIVSFRFVQILWLSGIADPAYQAMFNVVPAERRDQVRTFIEGVPQQAGTFLAGAILIIGEQRLAPQQLYVVGLFAAAVCTFAIERARRGYLDALIEALHAGNPHIFYSEEEPFGGFRQDAAAIGLALNGLADPDPLTRRISAEILEHLSLPEAEEALARGLSDADPLVRASCLRALARAKAISALEKIAVSLQDPEPDVRFEAVAALAALTVSPSRLERDLHPMLDDPDTRVSTRAASALLKTGREAERAKDFLRHTAALGELAEREHAILAMGEWGDAEAYKFLVNELEDSELPIQIRRAVLTALARIDVMRSMPYLVDALGHRDVSVRGTSADLLSQAGEAALEPVLLALQNPAQEEGALLALQRLPVPPLQPLDEYARAAVSRALEYDCLMRGVRHGSQGEAARLLIESLQTKSSQHGMRALRAIGLRGDRAAMRLAIEFLQTRNSAQQAVVMETLESLEPHCRKIIQPLMRLWEEGATLEPVEQVDWQRLISDEDEWIRDCAWFAAHQLGELKMENISTLSLMERILFLKRVPLFANFSPADLKQVAAISQEASFSDGTAIVRQGEEGDVMFIVVSGEVLVSAAQGHKEIVLARRKPGEYVGEMALISKEPRIATLTAVGNVHTLCIDQKSFESLLRDRPDVSLAVIQILCKRLKEVHSEVMDLR
ncbi:MAG TPA: HEAT repeat domain-containing protein, partial [Anaerolineales bacterium]|nr:HEAT repeat domain-containing protein [Anaerolineales bacterium]